MFSFGSVTEINTKTWHSDRKWSLSLLGGSKVLHTFSAFGSTIVMSGVRYFERRLIKTESGHFHFSEDRNTCTSSMLSDQFRVYFYLNFWCTLIWEIVKKTFEKLFVPPISSTCYHLQWRCSFRSFSEKAEYEKGNMELICGLNLIMVFRIPGFESFSPIFSEFLPRTSRECPTWMMSSLNNVNLVCAWY